MPPLFVIDRQEIRLSGEATVLRETITSQHFGGNLLITNAQEQQLAAGGGFGQAISDAGIKNLRFPGGTVTEQFFDMTNPEARGTAERPLIWQSQFLNFASEINASVTMVIPTRCGFEMNAAAALEARQYGVRAVSQTYVADVRQYVFDTIVAASRLAKPVDIQAFEIGNEFWASGQMTASEYGRVAAAILQAATAAINDAISQGYLDAADRPHLVMQSVTSAGYMSPSGSSTVYVSGGEVYQSRTEIPAGQSFEAFEISGQGNSRTQLNDILDEVISAGAGSLVDGLVDHYYNAQGYAVVDAGEQFIFRQFDFAEQRLGLPIGSLERFVTEWNTKRAVDTNDAGSENNPEFAQNRGLPQAGMLVEMFYEMVTHGVHSANIWPLWFASGNSTTLFDNDSFTARVPAAILGLMEESLVGTIPLFDQETTSGAFMLDTHGFESADGMVLLSQNRSSEVLTSFAFDLDSVPSTSIAQRLDTQHYFIVFTELSATLNGVTHSGANGEEVTPELTWTDGQMQAGDMISYTPDSGDRSSGLDPSAILRTEITFITSGADEIFGRGGNDHIRGGLGDDRLFGGDGNDRLLGEAGNDVLFGGAGHDLLFGGRDNDIMIGGTGNDTYVVDSTNDRVFETTTTTSTIDVGGIDTVQSSVTFGLDASAGVRFVERLTLTGTANINGTGNALANILIGNAGNNVLKGGRGNDTLIGGAGNDTLFGGAGGDTFVFNTVPSSTNVDRIRDFNVAEDEIRFDDSVFSGLAAGALGASAFAANLTGTATDTLDRIIYETDTGRLYFDADGNGVGARVHVATLTANLALTNADFLVF